MDQIVKENHRMLPGYDIIITLFTALCIALTARVAHADLNPEQMARVDKIVDVRETLTDDKFLSEVAELKSLAEKDPKNDELYAQQARLLFFMALNETDKEKRIEKYQRAIDAAEQATKVNPKSASGHFWRAAAIGRQGLDKGVLKALNNASTMRDSLEITIEKNEKIERGAAHRALGRLYYELPGFPLSFGNNKKALEHLEKAYAIGPQEPANNAYYAQMLVKNGKKDEAKKYIDYVLAYPVKPEHKLEMAEYRRVAEETLKKMK